MEIKSLHGLICILSVASLCSCKKTDDNKIEHDTPPAHPRIHLLGGELESIRQTIISDYSLRTISRFIIAESEKVVSKPPVERVLIGKRLLDKSSEALRRIFFLSSSWRMTSDLKYLNIAEQEMLAVSAFSDWNPSHYLDVAEMTMAVAIGYDWMYDYLSASSRSIIKEAIIEKGLKPSLTVLLLPEGASENSTVTSKKLSEWPDTSGN
jgi:hypothetical protein